jgi:hypothetical protein
MKKWITIPLLYLYLHPAVRKKECPGPADKNFSLTNFKKVSAADTFTVTVSRGFGV